MLWRPAAISLLTLTIAACGGGGGNSGDGRPAPAVSLGAAPASVVAGKAATLSWEANDASDCTASGGWSGAKGTNGSESTGDLAATTTYTLTCNGAGGTTAETATITVTTPPAPTLSLSVSPTTITAGSSATLTWNATDADACTASGSWSSSRSVSGTQSTGALAGNASYTLTCTGDGGSTSETVSVTVTAVVGVPAVNLAASPSNVTTGAPSTLTWSTANVTNCTASGGWTGPKAHSGTQSTGNLAATTNYTLTCDGAGGSATQSVTVTATPPPATVTLAASPTTIASGAFSTLTWSSTNTTGCTASGGWTGTKGTSGAQSTGTLNSTTTFTISCLGGGGSVSRSATVNVAPAPTVTLAANPTTVAGGSASSLTWSSTNTTSCTASDGWTGTKATSGTESTANLASSTTYTLTCTGTGGSASQSATVTVAPAPTVTLAANPSSVASGSASNLTWSSINATSCTASVGWTGAKATSGSQSTGNLTATSTYTLACTGPGGGPVSQSATVTVTPPPPTVTFSANPTTVAGGASSTLTWSSTNATGCTASGGWIGARSTSGSEPTSNLTSTTTYTLTCTGAGGATSRSATVTVTTGGGGSIFPLRVEAGKRYLVTAQGDPFLVQGDAPWLLITNLTKEEAVTYLDDRQAKGYNTLLVELIERNRSINKPANVYNDPPFSPEPGEFSSPPVDAYFDHAEYIIGQARQRGMLVLLTPSYMGFDGRENHWYPAMGRAGNPLLREYGQYIAERFQDYDNILWVHGGDYNPPDRTRLRAVMDGIQDVETESLHTFHGSRGTSALGWAGGTEPWLEVNNVYADEDTVISESQIEWERPGTMPYFFIEGDYEDEAASALETRQQAWQAVLSGNAGQVTGQASVWKFEPGVWPSKLDTEGASTLVHLRTLFEDYSWWTLVPDFANTFLTAGQGTGAARAPAAKAADGSFAFIYTRDIRDLTVNLGGLSGSQVQALWYDPTSGSSTTVTGSPFAATGSRVFRPTGVNSRGKNDWVLVLDAIP